MLRQRLAAVGSGWFSMRRVVDGDDANGGGDGGGGNGGGSGGGGVRLLYLNWQPH